MLLILWLEHIKLIKHRCEKFIDLSANIEDLSIVITTSTVTRLNAGT